MTRTSARRAEQQESTPRFAADWSAGHGRRCRLAVVLLAIVAPAMAAEPPGPATQPAATTQAAIPADSQVEQFSVHGQGTVITQKHDAFPAPYAGRNSVPRREDSKTSVTGTLFMGLRLPWQGGELYFDPEVASGEGFGGTTGIAGFPNGEIPRVGTPEPEPYIARAFLRQTFGLGGEKERVAADANQLAGYRDVDRLTVTFGKVSAVDFFQTNAYSGDPRLQFENWALFTDGAWDYPADVRGYTIGAVTELNQANWTLRYGNFLEPKVANQGTLDPHTLKALGHSVELEERYTIANRPGAVRPMVFANVAHMGNYQAAIDHPGPDGRPDVTLTRTYRVKYGFGVSAEQQITDDLGVFSRVSWNDGHTETWAFTEIDRSYALGLGLKGTRWHRPDDVVGVAVLTNGLSGFHRRYLGDGGFGFIIGDGKLPRYAQEDIGEAYYLIKVYDHVFVTGDFQIVDHPAYNRDRGPIVIGGVRVHAEF